MPDNLLPFMLSLKNPVVTVTIIIIVMIDIKLLWIGLIWGGQVIQSHEWIFQVTVELIRVHLLDVRQPTPPPYPFPDHLWNHPFSSVSLYRTSTILYVYVRHCYVYICLVKCLCALPANRILLSQIHCKIDCRCDSIFMYYYYYYMS